MRRWIIFGLVIMLAFVAAANLNGPSAWASDQSQGVTVPTRTPKPAGTPVPPTPKPPKEPSNTPAPAPTNTPVIVPPTNTPIVIQPSSTATVVQLTPTTIPQISNTATATTVAAEETPTATAAAIDQATATATTPVETTLTATPESTTAAAVITTSPGDGGANIEPVKIAPAAEQPSSSAATANAPSIWLLIIAVALLLFGAVLVFGRRRKDDAK